MKPQEVVDGDSMLGEEKGRGYGEGRREIKKKMFPMNTTTLSSKGTR
jgi:hypothetical protein